MTRLPPLEPGEMSAEQTRLAAEITATRGALRGPFAVWLRAPAMAALISPLGMHLRTTDSLAPQLRELAVLIVARHWRAQYEWWAHEKLSRDAGVPASVIEAIKHRRVPPISDPDMLAVYDLASELLESRSVSDETYDRALAFLGETALIEMVAIIGYYSMIAMTLNAFEAPVPDGEAPPLD